MAESEESKVRNLARALQAHLAVSVDRAPGPETSPARSQRNRSQIVVATASGLNALDQALYARWEGLFNDEAYEDADMVDQLRGSVTTLQIDLGRRLIAALDAGLAAAEAKIGHINNDLKAEKEATEAGAKNYAGLAGTLDQLARLLGWIEKA